jgi:hypothetical protein
LLQVVHGHVRDSELVTMTNGIGSNVETGYVVTHFLKIQQVTAAADSCSTNRDGGG